MNQLNRTQWLLQLYYWQISTLLCPLLTGGFKPNLNILLDMHTLSKAYVTSIFTSWLGFINGRDHILIFLQVASVYIETFGPDIVLPAYCSLATYWFVGLWLNIFGDVHLNSIYEFMLQVFLMQLWDKLQQLWRLGIFAV